MNEKRNSRCDDFVRDITVCQHVSEFVSVSVSIVSSLENP